VSEGQTRSLPTKEAGVRAFASVVVTVTLVLAAGSCRGPVVPDDRARNDEQSVVSQGASCVEEYSPRTLRNRAFAFDGTVISIELRTDPKLEVEDEEDSRIPWVTFSVHRWYRGGSGDDVGVWLENLNIETSAGTVTAEPGTRLLVTGEPRRGGAPLDDAIAWGCGFTRPYTAEAAEEWEAAFRD
jgi:hypothetical protein